MYVDSKREWLHVVSTEKLTSYAANPKRGQEATKEIGILPDFQGTAVHDFCKPYYQYAYAHALYNSHHLRELTSIAEQDRQQWPPEMKDLLLRDQMGRARSQGKDSSTMPSTDPKLRRKV